MNKKVGCIIEARTNSRRLPNKVLLPVLNKPILYWLIKRIKTEYNLNIINIIGHSDIAPQRKSDPGELFDWERLANKKLAFWPKMQKQKTNIKFLQIGEKSQRVREIKRKLKKIGYKCSSNNTYDLSLKLVVEAFQRRFLPDRINGIIDAKVYVRIINISENT